MISHQCTILLRFALLQRLCCPLLPSSTLAVCSESRHNFPFILRAKFHPVVPLKNLVSSPIHRRIRPVRLIQTHRSTRNFPRCLMLEGIRGFSSSGKEGACTSSLLPRNWIGIVCHMSLPNVSANGAMLPETILRNKVPLLGFTFDPVCREMWVSSH